MRIGNTNTFALPIGHGLNNRNKITNSSTNSSFENEFFTLSEKQSPAQNSLQSNALDVTATMSDED